VPTSALDNPLILPILGLLAERPRHPYAVFSELRQRYSYLRVRNATVYTLLDTLRARDWVAAPDAGEREALRLTSAGASALAERVEAELRAGDLTGGPSFMAALAYVSILPPDRAAAALRARTAVISDETRRLRQVLDDAGGPEIHMIEVHYLLARLEHDRQWLTTAARRIETGELAWLR
jgi:DNA-binding PadR family transcriptional regulator